MCLKISPKYNHYNLQGIALIYNKLNKITPAVGFVGSVGSVSSVVSVGWNANLYKIN